MEHQNLRSMDGEVFEYAIGSMPRFPGTGMFGAMNLPEPANADEVINAIADSARELDGYGVTTSFHGMETYGASEKRFDGEKPLIGKVSVTKLGNNDSSTEVLTPNTYFEEILRDKKSRDVETEDWNFYVDLDGQVCQVLVDEYRRDLDYKDEVFDQVFEKFYSEMGFEGKDTPEPVQKSDVSFRSFSPLFDPWDRVHGFVEFQEARMATEFTSALKAAVEQLPGYKSADHSAGTEGYIYRNNGDIWLGESHPSFHSISAIPDTDLDTFEDLEEKLMDKTVNISNQSIEPDPDPRWTFAVSYDGDSTGFYANGDSLAQYSDNEILDRIIDEVADELDTE